MALRDFIITCIVFTMYSTYSFSDEQIKIDSNTKNYLSNFYSKNTSELPASFRDLEDNVNPIKLPIGTVLPVFPPSGDAFRLPKGWEVADGRLVVDARSPFNGEKLPNLTSSIFLMGSDIDNLGTTGGSNALPSAGNHNHSGTTGGGPRGHGVDNGRDKRPSHPGHRHSFSTSSNGNHNHGGDNRPSYFGVIYVIRIF